MGTYTTNYNLFMPTIGEQGWGDLVNGNFSTIDTTMKGLNTRLTAVENEVNGNLSCTSVATSGTMTSTGKITTNGGIGTTSLTTSSTITSTGKITANGGIGTKALTTTSISNSGNMTNTGTLTCTGKIIANGGIDIGNLTTLTSESGIIGGVYCSADNTLVSSGSGGGSKTVRVTYKSNPLNNTVRFDFYTAAVSHTTTNSGSIAINGTTVKTFSATGDTNGLLNYHSSYSTTLNDNDVITLTTTSSTTGYSRGAAIKLHIAGYLISN